MERERGMNIDGDGDEEIVGMGMAMGWIGGYGGVYGCIYAVVREDDDVCWLEPRCRCCGIDPPLTTTFCHGSNEIFNPKTGLQHDQFSFRNGQVILPQQGDRYFDHP